MKKFLILLMLISASTPAWADKSWNAEGDKSDWYDGANWLPSGTPAQSEDAKVDLKDASVEIGQTLEVQSLTIGGKKHSTVTLNNFVSGTIQPDHTTDNAVHARRDGKLILKGSVGKLTLKGAYKDSEEVIPEEPSFLLYAK